MSRGKPLSTEGIAPAYLASVEKRFWGSLRTHPTTGCMERVYGRGYQGYGCTTIKAPGRVMLGTHRMAWLLAHGSIPRGAYILHRCDNKLCCNPAHLYLGSPKDNGRDSVNRGQQVRGEDHWCAKLTEKAVKEIRAKHATGKYSLKDLGDEYGVVYSAIGYVVHRKAWKHV